MSQSFQIEDAAFDVVSEVGTNVDRTFSANDTFITYPFIAFDNWIINRVAFRLSSGGGTYSFTVGIGTWDTTNYRPWTLAGAGRTLQYSSSKVYNQGAGVAGSALIAPSGSALYNIASIPDFVLTRGQKYYIGFGFTGTTAPSPGWNINLRAYKTPSRFTNMRSIIRSSATTQVGDNSLSVTWNWGYDAGDAKTVWYNPYFDGFNTSFISPTSARYVGTSIYLDTDFNSLYLDSVNFHIRSPNVTTFPTATGVTYEITLFDSNASTALIAHTQTFYPNSINAVRSLILPVKYELLMRKYYYLGIRYLPSLASATNNQIYTVFTPTNIANSGVALSTQAFIMTSLGTPSMQENEKILACYRFDILKGSRQGGIGSASGREY